MATAPKIFILPYFLHSVYYGLETATEITTVLHRQDAGAVSKHSAIPAGKSNNTTPLRFQKNKGGPPIFAPKHYFMLLKNVYELNEK